MAFLTPFLNEATWLSAFLAHYKPILSANPENKMIFIEGATSFHSAAEHRLGLSVDKSEEIIQQAKTEQIIHIRKGKVGLLSELLNEGYRHCDKQKYILPLMVSDFVDEEIFSLIDNQNVDLIHLPRTNLVGDFRHYDPKADDIISLFLNIEGLSFQRQDMIPYWEDVRLDEIGKKIVLDACGTSQTKKDKRGRNSSEENRDLTISQDSPPVIGVEKIETQFQSNQRIARHERFAQWHKKNFPDVQIKLIDSEFVCGTSQTKGEQARRLNGNAYWSKIPSALKNHEWFLKEANEIWDYPVVFPIMTTRQTPNQSQGEKSILEIGCATGQTLLYYQQRGWKAIGIEPSLWASGYGRHILDVDIRTGTAMDFDFPKKEFSIIAFWDSFEHISDPMETLLHIRDWLAEDGRLMIYTPDVSKWGDDERHFLWSPRQHFFLYTPETLRKMLEKVGFRVISTDRKIDPHGFFMVAQKGEDNANF